MLLTPAQVDQTTFAVTLFCQSYKLPIEIAFFLFLFLMSLLLRSSTIFHLKPYQQITLLCIWCLQIAMCFVAILMQQISKECNMKRCCIFFLSIQVGFSECQAEKKKKHEKKSGNSNATINRTQLNFTELGCVSVSIYGYLARTTWEMPTLGISCSRKICCYWCCWSYGRFCLFACLPATAAVTVFRID